MWKIWQRPCFIVFVFFLISFLFIFPPEPAVAADLTLQPVSTSLSVTPPGTVTVLFRAKNHTAENLEITLELELPQGWSPLIPPGTTTLAPNSSRLLTFPIRVPERARAKKYKIGLAGTNVEKGISQKASLSVSVEKTFQVTIEGPPEGKQVIPGDEVAYSVYLINQGNIPSKFSVSASSICPVGVDKKTVDLVAGERAEVRLTQTIPEDVTDRRECSLTVTVESTMKTDVRDEFMITTRILPSPPEEVSRDLGLAYETTAFLSESWSADEGRSTDLSLFGYGQTPEIESGFSLSFDNILEREIDFLDELDFYASLPGYSFELGDVSFSPGRWFSISGRGIGLDVVEDSFSTLSLACLEGQNYGAKLDMTGEKYQLSFGGTNSGEESSLFSGIDVALTTGRDKDTWGSGIEMGIGSSGWAGRLWGNWKREWSTLQSSLQYTNAPFAGSDDSDVALNLSQTLKGDVINLWAGLSHKYIWDTEGSLTRTGFDLGASGGSEDYLDYNLGLRYEFRDGSLNETTYNELSNRISGGLGFDFEKVSWDLDLIYKTTNSLDFSRISRLSDISFSVTPEIRTLSPTVSFSWSKTEDFVGDVTEKEAQVTLSDSGIGDEFDRSFSATFGREDDSFTVSGSLGTELPGGGYASISAEGTEESFSVELDLEKSFSYVANWFPVKGQATGRVFLDEDLDGQLNKTEPGLSEVILKLDDSLASTNENGAFAFSPALPGTYDLQLVKLPTNYVTMVNTPRTISLTAGERTRVDIPIAEASRVSGKVVRLPELTDNQDQPNREEQVTDNQTSPQPMDGVGLRLVSESRSYYTRSGASGRFSFGRLRPGKWRIEVDEETLPERHYPKQEKIKFQLKQGGKKELKVVIYEEEREIEWIG